MWVFKFFLRGVARSFLGGGADQILHSGGLPIGSFFSQDEVTMEQLCLS